MYARGTSVRGIEAAFMDDNGRTLLTRTAVSEITERLWAEYEGLRDAGFVGARRECISSSTGSRSDFARGSHEKRCCARGRSTRTGFESLLLQFV